MPKAGNSGLVAASFLTLADCTLDLAADFAEGAFDLQFRIADDFTDGALCLTGGDVSRAAGEIGGAGFHDIFEGLRLN
jgi:hypothetical protein